VYPVERLFDRRATRLGYRSNRSVSDQEHWPHDHGVTYRAKAALPYLHHERAVTGLRGHLRKLTAAEGVTPDWSTLRVAGPVEVIGAHGVVWYEWTAEVDIQRETARHL
jgi:hypothetical protein